MGRVVLDDGVVRLLSHSPGQVDLPVQKGIGREPTAWSPGTTTSDTRLL